MIARAQRKSLADTIYDRSYFPAVTHQRMQAGVPADMGGHYDGLIDKVLGGSNVANYATGNASGTVGFAGGPQTFAANGERFGVEGPDRGWAERMSDGAAPASQVRVATAPAIPSASSSQNGRPMATNEIGQYIPDDLIKQQLAAPPIVVPDYGEELDQLESIIAQESEYSVEEETKVNEEDLTVVKEQYAKSQDKIIKDLQETEAKLRDTMEHSELVDQRR